MAEINKIKVGETTYDVNPSWAYNTTYYTCLGDGDRRIVLGTMPTNGDGKVRKAMMYAKNIEIYTESGQTVKLDSFVTLDKVNFLIGTMASMIQSDDGEALYLGRPAKSIQIGTGTGSIVLNSTGSIYIGDRNKGITLGSDGNFKIGSGNEGITLSSSRIQIGSSTCSLYINNNGTSFLGRDGQGYAQSADGNYIIGGNIKIGSQADDVVDFSGRRVNIYNLASPQGAAGYVRIGNTDLSEESHIILDGDVEMKNGTITIGSFLFETDTSASKLTISYNGKKAEIQLA